MDDPYLIWSHEHSAWWGANRRGYTRRLSEAGRYTHIEAVAICVKSIPGTAQRMEALPELPVRLADVDVMMKAFHGEHPGRGVEPWE